MECQNFIMCNLYVQNCVPNKNHILNYAKIDILLIFFISTNNLIWFNRDLTTYWSLALHCTVTDSIHDMKCRMIVIWNLFDVVLLWLLGMSLKTLVRLSILLWTTPNWFFVCENKQEFELYEIENQSYKMQMNIYNDFVSNCFKHSNGRGKIIPFGIWIFCKHRNKLRRLHSIERIYCHTIKPKTHPSNFLI